MDGSSSMAPTQNILPKKWLKQKHINVKKWPSRSPDLSGRSWGVCAKRQQKDLKHLECVHKVEWAKTFPGMCLNLRKVLVLFFPTSVFSLSTKLWSNTYFTQLHTKWNYHKNVFAKWANLHIHSGSNNYFPYCMSKNKQDSPLMSDKKPAKYFCWLIYYC